MRTACTVILMLAVGILPFIMAANKSSDVKSLQNAAERGDATAQYNIGLCYSNGSGVTANEEETVKWVRKAERQNYEPVRKILRKSNIRW